MITVNIRSIAWILSGSATFCFGLGIFLEKKWLIYISYLLLKIAFLLVMYY